MKRSELKNIVKEILFEEPYIDLSKQKVGDVKIDPETGIKSTLTKINPETGGLSWDISYEVDPLQVYNKIDDLLKYMSNEKGNTELNKIKDVLKQLKNKTHRLVKSSK